MGQNDRKAIARQSLFAEIVIGWFIGRGRGKGPRRAVKHEDQGKRPWALRPICFY